MNNPHRVTAWLWKCICLQNLTLQTTPCPFMCGLCLLWWQLYACTIASTRLCAFILTIVSLFCFPLVAKICPLKNSISDSHTLLSVLVRAFSSCVRMLHGAFSHKDVASFRPKALQKWLAIPSAEIEVPLKTLLATEEVAMFPLKNWGTCHCRSGWPLKKWPLSH